VEPFGLLDEERDSSEGFYSRLLHQAAPFDDDSDPDYDNDSEDDDDDDAWE